MAVIALTYLWTAFGKSLFLKIWNEKINHKQRSINQTFTLCLLYWANKMSVCEKLCNMFTQFSIIFYLVLSSVFYLLNTLIYGKTIMLVLCTKNAITTLLRIKATLTLSLLSFVWNAPSDNLLFRIAWRQSFHFLRNRKKVSLIAAS